MMPKYTYLAASLLFALCCGRTARSDDAPKPAPPPDPCVTDLTLEKLGNPPERKTKFEVAEDVRKERLFDIKAADQKFAALIRIKLPKPYQTAEGVIIGGVSSSQWRDSEERRPLLDLQVFPDRHLLRPSSRDPSFGTFSDAFGRMIAQVPTGRVPEEARKELASSEIDRSVIAIDPARRSGGVPQTERGLLILGRTPEEAERRTGQLLLIFDQGFSRPLQMGLFKEREAKCNQLRELQQKLPAAKKSYEVLMGKIKEYEEFTPDLLAGLKVQQLQMEVDVAGVKAKIATCEKLLAKTQGIAERSKPIEEAMIAAEIELSGFEARRAKAAEFVGKVKDRNELAARAAVAENAIGESNQTIGYLSHLIRGIDEEIAAFAPVTLVDDRVTIHPLEWTQ